MDFKSGECCFLHDMEEKPTLDIWTKQESLTLCIGLYLRLHMTDLKITTSFGTLCEIR